MEFVNLNEEDSLDNISENSNLIKPRNDIELPEDIEVPQIEYTLKTESEDEEVLEGSCGIEEYYGDRSEYDYFKIENLFSELVNDYQRAKARYNLGIGEEYAILWGNIHGLIDNQEDLTNYIYDTFSGYINNYSEDINALLIQWAIEINNKLSQKVDKYSPHLEGIPTTTLPDINDDSSRIASTEWVNAKLSLSEDYNLKELSLNKTYMFYGDPPQTIILSWDFYNNPEEIRINGLIINPSSRAYSFINVNDNMLIHFSYKTNDKWYNKIVSFEKIYAYYYGTEDNISLMTKTKNSTIIVNSLSNKFVYLCIPNDGNARLFVDNILGGFRVIGTIIIDGINYYIYRTVNSGLGQLYIKYDKQ